MRFGLAITATVEINSKINVIQALADELKDYFKMKNYGSGIKTFIIGIVCVSAQFDQFFKETKPKYIKGPKVMLLDGTPVTVENYFEYDLKLNFEKFKDANPSSIYLLLSGEILTSLSVIGKTTLKIKNFDANGFRHDIETYFIENGLISHKEHM